MKLTIEQLNAEMKKPMVAAMEQEENRQAELVEIENFFNKLLDPTE